MLPKTIFITAIDTDSGKTIVTGLLAKYLKNNGFRVITQKIAQTGCTEISIDILKHREIMEDTLNRFDLDGFTCPYVFKFASSPHLAAKLEGAEISLEIIEKATRELEQNFDMVLIEGVGGLCVPLTDDILLLDYLKKQNYPVILVSSSKLGSINHTILSLELLKNSRVEVIGMVYNHFPNNEELITEDSSIILKKYLKKFYPEAFFNELPVLNSYTYNFNF